MKYSFSAAVFVSTLNFEYVYTSASLTHSAVDVVFQNLSLDNNPNANCGRGIYKNLVSAISRGYMN